MRVDKLPASICLIIFILLFAVVGGCAGNNAGCDNAAHGNTDGGTTAPTATVPPAVAYTLTHIIRYWPEDADYDTCDYAAILNKPEFSNTYTAGYAMNKAVSDYIDALYERIEKEYMGLAVADPPYTEIDCVVEYIGDYTQVVFTEEHCYEAQPIVKTHVVVMDERGEAVDMNQVFSTYHAEEYIARRICAELDANDAYYGDKTNTEALAALSIKNGCRLTQNGCIAYLPEGMFAPYEYGELGIEIAVEDMYPPGIAGAGGVLTLSEFDGVREYTGYALSAVIVREQGIEDGVLTPYAATGFMGDAALKMGLVSNAGRVTVSQAAFEGLYYACFGTDFPGIDAAGHDIVFENNSYSISVKQQPYVYRLDITGAERQGDTLLITGDVIFGDYGYAYTTYICHAALALSPSSDSPFGYRIDTLELGL